MKKRENLKLLLMQVREDQETMREEWESFARHSCLKKEQIDVLNVFQTPHFCSNIIDEYDALLIGGASSANVLEQEKNSFYPSAFSLIDYCLNVNKPVFASCFGFQLATLHLGGEIKHKEEGFEMGTPLIELTNEAKDDPLFRDIKKSFYGVSVHKQYTDTLPPNCILLAQADYCLHSFKVKEKKFWTFQYHPELDTPTLKKRLKVYQESYVDNDGGYEKIIANLVETPESNQIVKNFIDRVLLEES